jgi:hypothetical protein
MSCLHEPRFRHYWVVSPEVMLSSGSDDPPEPPEYGCCYAEVLESSKRNAINQAISREEFDPWVGERRSDRKAPQAGCRAEPALCKHGVCWVCVEECPECAAEDRSEWESEL